MLRELRDFCGSLLAIAVWQSGVGIVCWLKRLIPFFACVHVIAELREKMSFLG